MAPSNRRRRLVAFVAVALVPLAIACNGIIGLSEYDRAECSGGGSCTDVFRPDGPINEGGIDSGDAKVDGGSGASPVSWARWRMPNYPAEAGLPNPPVYSVAPDEVTETGTGLIWRKTLQDANAIVTFEGAVAACKKIGPSADTWRVPKRIELVTLLDYGHAKPFIDQTVFAGIAATRVWSSSEVRPFTGGPKQAYWTVSFDTGAVETQDGSQAAAATLCVKAK